MLTQPLQRSYNILVVDDDLDTLTLLSRQLSHAGYQVTTASSGLGAIQILNEQKGCEDPLDLLILDVMIPDMSGFDILNAIRSDPELTHLQVIILTCLSTPNDMLQALQAGANDFMVKPWESQELLSRTRQLLARRSQDKSIAVLNKNRNALQLSSRALLGVHSLNEVLMIILHQLKDVLDYDSTSIMLVQGQSVKIMAEIGFRSGSQEFSNADIASLEHVQAVLRTRQALIITNTFRDRRWLHLPDSDYIATWMGIPLIVKDQVIGLLNIDKAVPDYYTAEDMELASGFAVQAALAIDNAKLLEQLERQTRLTKALVQASRELAETKDPEVQLGLIRQFMLEQLNAPMFYVGFCDRLNKTLHIRLLYDKGTFHPAQQIRLEGGESPSLAAYVALTGSPIEWNDPTEKERAVKSLNIIPHQVGTACCTCFVKPLIVEGETIGVISIQSDLPNAWDEIELDAFQTLTSLAAIAASNSQHFKSIIDDQSRLYTAFDASNFVAGTDLNMVLPAIVKKLREVTNCSRASVVIIDKNGRPIHRVSDGDYSKKRKISSMRPDGISNEVARSGIPKFFEDTAQYAALVHPDMMKDGIKAAACLPLRYNNESIGVMWVHFDNLHRFSANERETLMLYGSQVAGAYENVRRLHELEQLRQAAEGFSAATNPSDVLRLIVSSARKEFQADSVALWAYDEHQESFITENSIAEGITEDIWAQFKQKEPSQGETTYKVMERGWVPIRDIDDAEGRAFLGRDANERLTRIGVKSFQGLALKVGEEKLGVLYINYTESRGFGDTERETAQAFANQAALALKKAKLFDLLEKAWQTARIVAEQTILGDYHGSLGSIVKGTMQVIGCDTVTLYSYNQDVEQFSFPPAIAGVRFPDKVLELDYVEKNSVPYRIVAMNQLYKSEFADTDPVVCGNFTEREGIKSFIGVPLVSHQTKVGVMCLSFRHRHRFTSSEISTIELFALQAAVAIQHGSLYKTIEDKAEILDALNRAGQAVTESLDRGEILKMIVKWAYDLTGIHGLTSRSSSIGLLENDNKLVFLASYPESYLAGLKNAVPAIPIDSPGNIGICGRAVLTGKSQLVNDVRVNQDYIPYDPDTRSEIAVPIHMNDRVIGVINAEHSRPGAFKEEDQLALEALTAFAAIALENANTYIELRDAKQRTALMADLAMAGTFAGAWRHSIGNQAVIISDLTQLIRDDLQSGASAEEIGVRLKHIENIVEEIQEIPMLPLSAEEGVESVLINQVVADRVRQFSKKSGRFKKVEFLVDLQMDSDISVRLSREWLRRILDCFIDNSVFAMKDSPQKSLTVRTRLEGERVEILVLDTGPGIPPEVQKKLFRAYIKKEKGERGSGLGLFISSEIARTYGGGLEIESTGPSGTTMLAWFPRES